MNPFPRTTLSASIALRLIAVGLPFLSFLVVPLIAGAAQTSASTWYLAPDGSDANACTAPAPCATLGKAYRAASPGDTVIMTCGSVPVCRYPDQSILYQFAKSGVQGR